MAFVTLDDQTARMELAVFSQLYSEKREAIRKDNLVVVYGQVTVDEYTGGFRMAAEKLFDWEEARVAFGERIILSLENGEIKKDRCIEKLRKLLKEHGRGRCPVWIKYANAQAVGMLKLGSDWEVRPTTAFFDALVEAFGSERVEAVFHRFIERTASDDVEHAA